jgi:hypothetical protein
MTEIQNNGGSIFLTLVSWLLYFAGMIGPADVPLVLSSIASLLVIIKTIKELKKRK